jgi:hypothetical protein
LSTNLEDEIARGAVVTHNKELLWPNPNPPKLDAGKAQKAEVAKEEKAVVTDLWGPTMKNALTMAAALSSIVGLGVLCPDPSFMTMFSTFSLALIAAWWWSTST